MIPAFPKIQTLGTKFVLDIFKDKVEITEKLDGSQFCFGYISGDLLMRSRGKEIYLGNPDKMFVQAVDYVCSIKDRLPHDIVFYCEYMQKPKHNTLNYGRVPKNHLMLFGMSTPDQTFVQHHHILSVVANKLEIEVAPLLFYGNVEGEIQDMLNKYLETESFCGSVKIEGVVIKNYDKSIWMGDRFIPIMCGKFVSEAFKEKHSSTWKADHTSRGGYEGLKDSYRSEARWLKAIYASRDNGTLQMAPQDIGPLIKAIHEDITIEEKEAIKTELWALFYKEIMGASTRGFAEWYKEWLVKETYNAVD
jgi:hypothetical protein